MRLCKQIAIIMMAAVMMFSMTGCGKGDGQKGSGSKSQNEISEDFKSMVYKSSDITFDGAQGDIQGFVVKGDKVYFKTCEWFTEETSEKETQINRLYVANMDGSNVTEIPMPQIGDDGWIYNMSVNDSGEIILVINIYDQMRETSTYYVWKIDEKGEELSKEDITKEFKMNEGGSLNKILFDNQGRLIIVMESAVKVLDNDYKVISEVKCKYYLSSAAITGDGQIVCGYVSEDGLQVQMLDVDNGKWGDTFSLDIPYSSNMDSLMSGDADYDFYYSDDKGVYGFTIAENKSIKLMDYVASDIPTDHTYHMIPLSKDLMIAGIWNEEVNTRLIQYTKVDPSEVPDKTTIVFGGIYTDDDIKSAAMDFNQQSDKYRIEFKDYSDDEDPMMKMNADMVAGNIPDILFIRPTFIEQYVSKGILEDLTPYFDKDPELNTSDMIPSLLEAMKIDGKLYYVTPDFGVDSMVGSADLVGTKCGWTFDEFKALLKEQGEDIWPFSSNNKSIMLNTLLRNGMFDFVDWKTGECHFDSQDFRDILEICNSGTNEEPDNENTPSAPVLIQQGKVWFNYGGVNLDDMQIYQKMFDGDITFIGYPNEKKEGSYFYMSMPIGISTKSEVKEGAWEFIRVFMTKEYQANVKRSWATPTRQDCFDMMIEAHMATKGYTDEFGQEINPVDNLYNYGDGWEAHVGPSTQKEVDLYVDLINNTKRVDGYDYKIMGIIDEETKAYFVGDKSLEDTVDIIQSRVTTYVNENR